MHSEEPKTSGARDQRQELSDCGVPATGNRESVRKHGLSPGWAVLVLIILLTALAVALFDWNLLKGYVERRVTIATGRELHIDGDLGVKLSMNPLITMDGLRLGNVAGARQPVMASAQRLQFRIALWPLLRGQTILPELHLVRPVVLLEKDAGGKDNWTFPGAGENPVIRQFTVDAGTVTYREDAAQTLLVINVNSERSASAIQLAPLVFGGKGLYRNNSITLKGKADSPLDLSRTNTPYRIDIDAVAGMTHAHASGALRNPLQINGFDLDFSLAGPDLGLLYKLIGSRRPRRRRIVCAVDSDTLIMSGASITSAAWSAAVTWLGTCRLTITAARRS